MKKTIFYLGIILFSGISLQAQSAFEVTVTGEKNGRSVFFFPGFACTGEVWDETIPEISKDYKCYVFTFAGFGNVPPLKGNWLKTIQEEIVDFIKDEKIENPVLVGHSFGGTLSYSLAIFHPDLFAQIIAVDALPGLAALMIPGYDGEEIPYENPYSTQLLNMKEEEFNFMVAQQVQFMCLNQDKHSFLSEMIKAADRNTYVNGYIDMMNVDIRADMDKIKIPVTVLAATFPDLETVKKTYEDQFKKLPSADIRYAENAAHFIMFDQPDWFLQNLRQSLKQHEKRTGF